MSSSDRHGLVTHGATRKRKDRDASDPPEPATNWLLAGYLAHEFLTNGTLLGSSARPEPVTKPKPKRKAEPEMAQGKREYADVARLMTVDGVHVPGIVNPTQLARLLQM